MDGRIQELKQDIAHRIRRVMPNIPQDEFDRLVNRMAELQYRYETKARDNFFGRLNRPDSF